MRGSQVVGIAVGWLAVALSMAAIGSASIAQVGGNVTEPQVQITVMRSIDTGNSDVSPAPGVDTSMAVAALSQQAVRSVSFATSAKPVTPARTTAAAVRAKTSSATPQPAPASIVTTAPVAMTPVLAAPNDLALTDEPAPATTPAATPTPTKPWADKDHTTKHPYDSQTASTGPVVAADSVATWQRAMGAISAACQGTALASVRLKPSEGYEATQRTSQVRSAITFDGPCRVSVRVACPDGAPSFEVGD